LWALRENLLRGPRRNYTWGPWEKLLLWALRENLLVGPERKFTWGPWEKIYLGALRETSFGGPERNFTLPWPRWTNKLLCRSDAITNTTSLLPFHT
jgi:hypothetical protein